MTPEGKVKAAFNKAVKDADLITFPLIVCTHRGIPDRAVFLRGGVTVLIEFKRPEGGVLSEYQEQRIAEFRSLGFEVHVIASQVDARRLADELIERNGVV